MPKRGANAIRSSGSALFRSYGVELSPALFHIVAAAMGTGDLLSSIVVGNGQNFGKRLLAGFALKLINGHDVPLENCAL